MNAIQTDLLKFFINFIQNAEPDDDTATYLVKRMMKDKQVQEILVECLFRLEPFLTTELSLIRTKTKPSLALMRKESRLLVLAQDIKNLMKNFDSIKSAIGSISKTVQNFGTILNQTPSIALAYSQSSDSPLVKYLSSISGGKSVNNEEFEDFSKETWNKHMEVEKMLAAELYLYKARWDLHEQNHVRKVFWIKEKTGVKVRRLEEVNQKIKFEFIQELARAMMKIEDRVGMEERRKRFEMELMKDEENLVFVPDLLTAVEKIKSLLTVRQVLEFNRHEDDKVIQVLNGKMQSIAFEFLETQESLKMYVKYTQDLTNLLVKVIKRFDWPRDRVEGILDCARKMEFDEIDGMVMDLMKEYSTNLSPEAKSRGPDSPRKSKRNSPSKLEKKSPKSKLKIITSPPHSPSKDTDHPTISFKKVLSQIDYEIKSKNKKFSENLSEIMNNFARPPKMKLKEINIKTKKTEPKAEVKKTFTQAAVQTVTSFKLLKIKESSSQTTSPSCSSAASQTDLASNDIQKLENLIQNRDIIKDYQDFIQDKQSTKETQTEQKIVHKEFEDSKLLIRTMMRKHTAPSSHQSLLRSRTPLMAANDFSSAGSQFLKSFETGTLLTPNQVNEDNETIEEELAKATSEYTKEFGIFSQFLGYKKLDFFSIQKLWEEVINRRLSEGEKDKITDYLKEYEGCENYEVEKMKIIHMLMNFKKQGKDDKAFDSLVKGFKKTIRVLNKWRKFLILFIKKYVSKIIYDQRSGKLVDLYKIVVFYRLIKQDIGLMLDKKHVMKKSETSVVFKDENWLNTSRSPRLVKKTTVKSRLFSIKHNKSYERTLKIKSPARFHHTKDLQKLPGISNLLNLKTK